MRILYGVCGEGYGHSSRAKEIISHLKNQGHKILIITYGKAYEVLKKSNTVKTEGISVIYEKEKLSLHKTMFKSMQNLFKDFKNFKKIKSAIDKFSPEICISDMELITPIIAYLYKLPLISIDNQHLLTNTKTKIPKRYRVSYHIAKITIKSCVPKADEFIVLSFKKTKPTHKNTHIVSPILRKEITALKPKIKNYILVYLSKPCQNLPHILKSIPENFIIYGQDKSEKIKNIEFKNPSQNFIKDLANCKAIIGSAGFSLISEALYLKKPYFAIPLKGQFEQTFNAIFLKKSQLGTYSEKISPIKIKKFLSNLPIYRKNLKNYTINPREAILVLDKILKKYHKKPQVY